MTKGSDKMTKAVTKVEIQNEKLSEESCQTNYLQHKTSINVCIESSNS